MQVHLDGYKSVDAAMLAEEFSQYYDEKYDGRSITFTVSGLTPRELLGFAAKLHQQEYEKKRADQKAREWKRREEVRRRVDEGIKEGDRVRVLSPFAIGNEEQVQLMTWSTGTFIEFINRGAFIEFDDVSPERHFVPIEHLDNLRFEFILYDESYPLKGVWKMPEGILSCDGEGKFFDNEDDTHLGSIEHCEQTRNGFTYIRDGWYGHWARNQPHLIIWKKPGEIDVRYIRLEQQGIPSNTRSQVRFGGEAIHHMENLKKDTKGEGLKLFCDRCGRQMRRRELKTKMSCDNDVLLLCKGCF